MRGMFDTPFWRGLNGLADMDENLSPYGYEDKNQTDQKEKRKRRSRAGLTNGIFEEPDKTLENISHWKPLQKFGAAAPSRDRVATAPVSLARTRTDVVSA